MSIPNRSGVLAELSPRADNDLLAMPDGDTKDAVVALLNGELRDFAYPRPEDYDPEGDEAPSPVIEELGRYNNCDVMRVNGYLIFHNALTTDERRKLHRPKSSRPQLADHWISRIMAISDTIALRLEIPRSTSTKAVGHTFSELISNLEQAGTTPTAQIDAIRMMLGRAAIDADPIHLDAIRAALAHPTRNEGELLERIAKLLRGQQSPYRAGLSGPLPVEPDDPNSLFVYLLDRAHSPKERSALLKEYLDGLRSAGKLGPRAKHKLLQELRQSYVNRLRRQRVAEVEAEARADALIESLLAEWKDLEEHGT